MLPKALNKARARSKKTGRVRVIIVVAKVTKILFSLKMIQIIRLKSRRKNKRKTSLLAPNRMSNI